MKKDLLKQIIDKKIHCVFISPHADDVLLSCATLLENLVGKTPITVINVFTKAHEKPYTYSAKQFMKYSNKFTDADALYAERLREDKKAFTHLGITPINLGYEDALFRRKKNRTLLGKIFPEFDHIYPTYRWHILKGIATNDYAISELKKSLEKYGVEKTIIFAPLGLGNHVDHKIVRTVCEYLFTNLVFYSDFPYNIRLQNYGSIQKKSRIYRLKTDREKKENLLRLYKTQFEGLFGGGSIPEHTEVYFALAKQLN